MYLMDLCHVSDQYLLTKSPISTRTRTRNGKIELGCEQLGGRREDSISGKKEKRWKEDKARPPLFVDSKMLEQFSTWVVLVEVEPAKPLPFLFSVQFNHLLCFHVETRQTSMR